MHRSLLELGEINPSSNLPEIIEYVDLESVKGTRLETPKKLHIESAPSRAKRLAQRGDIFYQTVRPYQKNNYYFNKKDINFVFSTGYAQIRPDEINGEFLFYKLQTQNFVNKVLRRSTGTSYPAINSKDLSKIKIKISKSFREQEKIGILLKKMDDIITLEQEKVDKLELFSEQIFRMLYYKNWENSLQFNNSNQQWKETPLKEILLEKNSRTTENNEYPILSSTNNGLFLQSKYFKNQVASKNNIGYKILKKNQIVLSPQNLWLGNINYNDKIEIGIVSPSYKVFDIDNNYDKYLIGRVLNLKEMEQKYTSASEQGASVVRRNLNLEDFYNISINIPNFETQRLVSNLIKSIDMLTKKYNEQINLHKEYKKVLLRNLFV